MIAVYITRYAYVSVVEDLTCVPCQITLNCSCINRTERDERMQSWIIRLELRLRYSNLWKEYGALFSFVFLV